MSLHRACCPCRGENPYCDDCVTPTYTATGISGTVSLYADCTISPPTSGMWSSLSNVTYSLPSTLALNAVDASGACVWEGCSAWTTRSESIQFCTDYSISGFPEEGCDDPTETCSWDLRFRLCGSLTFAGVSIWQLRLHVEIEQRRSGGGWYTCHDYSVDPDVINFYPVAFYRDPSSPQPTCPTEDYDYPLYSDNDPVTDEVCCAEGDDCSSSCDEEVTGSPTFTSTAPLWRYDAPINWSSDIQITV